MGKLRPISEPIHTRNALGMIKALRR